MRGMSRWVVGVGLLLILIGALFVYDGWSSSEPEPIAEKVEDVDRTIAAREPTLVAPDETKPMPKAQLEPKPDPASADLANPQKAAAARPRMPASGDFELMQRAFESQTRDSAWASEQEARVPQLVTEAGFKEDAFDRNVTCRSTLCRFSLVIAEDDEDDLFALMKLSSKVQTSEGVPLSHGAAEAAGEKSRIVVFLRRDDAALEAQPKN
jgi:hypothetical protein